MSMPPVEEFVDTSAQVPVRGFLHRAAPSAGGLILTHGAGANCRTVLLTSLAEAFAAAGLTVLRCDLPFRQARPTGPPPRGSAERDQAGLRAAVDSMRAIAPGKVFLGGHSYGGRQASHVAAADPALVDRLLLLSFPLHPPQRPAQLRSKHFPDLRTPALFVHGERDGFGSIEEMEAARKLIPTRTELLPIPSAGHELMTARNRTSFLDVVVPAFLAFAQ
jgi:uncharacterized protein